MAGVFVISIIEIIAILRQYDLAYRRLIPAIKLQAGGIQLQQNPTDHFFDNYSSFAILLACVCALQIIVIYGGMAEWFKAAVLKTVVGFLLTGGSNPSPSANALNI